MSHLLALAVRSAWNRRLTLGLTVIAIALSVALLLGVERLRDDARESFSQSVSGTDLVIGARTSPIQLMLYSVFRIGDATNNVRWQSYQAIAARPEVSWTIPLSLGDSHLSYPVLGTDGAYFRYFRYRRAQPLEFAGGAPFREIFETVLGGITVVGSIVGTRVDLAETYELHARGLTRVIRCSRPLDDVADAMGQVERGEIDARVVFDLR